MRMLKYPLHPGMNKIAVDQDHLAQLKYVNSQDSKIMGWFEVAAEPNTQAHTYEVYLALTGEALHKQYRYITSHQLNQGGGFFVVHAYD